MFARRSHTTTTHHEKGPSLARGPAWIVGTILSVFGLMMFFKAAGTPLPTEGFPDGEVQGQSFLGFEANAWTAWLTTAAGVLVLIGAAQHAFAKTMSLLVGLALGAMSVIALFDGEDVFGLAAANGLTKLGWGIAAAFLIITALLPRVNRRTKHTEAVADRTTDRKHDRGGDGRDDRTQGTHDRDADGRDDRTEIDRGHGHDGNRATTPASGAVATGPAVSRDRDGVDAQGNDERTRIERGEVVSRDGNTEPEIATDDQRTGQGWPSHADQLAGRQQDAGIADPTAPRTTSNRTF